jgi:ABC-2 type transport system permease protein
VTLTAPSGTAAGTVTPSPTTPFLSAFAAVFAGQLSRAKVARASLLFVATLQSLGILVLVRGVVDTSSEVTKESVVAGSAILVIAFVALNLLTQRLGMLKAARALDYYAAVPVAPSAVVLGIAASYATFTVPGTALTAVVGGLLYGLPIGHLWVLVVVIPLAGAALAGLGALIGLLMPRPELATVAGQLGMTAVLFLGVIPADRLPLAVRVVRAAVPSTYAVDALAGSFLNHPDWVWIGWHLAVCAAVAAAGLAVASMAFRRAVAG